MVPSFQRLFCNEDQGIWQSLKMKMESRDEVPYWESWPPTSEIRGTVPRERKTHDEADGGGMTWTTSVLVTVAAPTNDQNLCDSKQHQCVSLHLWRSEMQKLVQWTKIKVPAGLHSFLEVSGENPFCCLFQLLENILHLGDIHSPSWRHSRHLRDSGSNLWFSYLILLSSTSFSTTTLPGPMHKEFVITLEWSRYSRNICHLIILITFVK